MDIITILLVIAATLKGSLAVHADILRHNYVGLAFNYHLDAKKKD